MSAIRLLAVCVLLVTAGCGFPLTDSSGAATTVDPTSPTASPTATATPLPESARNPWRSAEVVVGVDGSGNPEPSFVGLVEDAVAYWNGPGRPYATYPVTFRVEPDASDPDIVVVIRTRLACTDHEDVLGCAP